MFQSEEISHILPIDSAWRSSSIAIEPVSGIAETTGVISESAIGFFVLGVILILLVFGRKIISFSPRIYNYIFFLRDYEKIDQDKQALRILFLLFLICCPVASALSFKYGFLSFDIMESLAPVKYYLVVLSSLLLIFVLRSLILFVIDYVTERDRTFYRFNKLSIAFFILRVLLSLLPLPFAILTNTTDYSIIRIVVYSLFGLLFFMYLFYVGKILFSKVIPVFFAFLYLCTFEILPMSLIVGTLVKI